MVYTNSLTSKGQMTIPKALRDSIGLKVGAPVRMSQHDDRSILVSLPLSGSAVRRKVGPPTYSQPLSDKEKLRIAARDV